MYKRSQIVIYAFVLGSFTAVLNSCSDVSFEHGSGEFKSCTTQGAQLSNCLNENPILRPQQQAINVKANNEVDVLFVVDNSGSMSQEQVGIGNKINGFLDKIKLLSWQIALTTTDSRTDTIGPDGISRPWGDGQLRPFDSDTGSEYILRSTQSNLADAQTKLASAINVGTSGDGLERGINASYRAVERIGSSTPNRDFFRQNASLAIVIISDEDECSTGASGCPAATASRSDPATAANFIRSQFSSSKVVSFSSIIHIPNDSTCTTGQQQGNVYKAITNLTGGVLGSVCSNDYTSALNILGQKVTQLVNSVALICPPLDMDKDGDQDVTVVLSGGAIMSVSGFSVSGSTLAFTQGLPEGNHTFHYFCK